MSTDVKATVVSVKPSLESQPYMTVTMRFSNVGARAVTVSSFELVWPGGRHAVSGLDLHLEAGQDLLRTLRVGPGSGSPETLTAEQAHITLR